MNTTARKRSWVRRLMDRYISTSPCCSEDVKHFTEERAKMKKNTDAVRTLIESMDRHRLRRVELARNDER